MKAPPAANAPPVEARKSATSATTIPGLPRARFIAASFRADAGGAAARPGTPSEMSRRTHSQAGNIAPPEADSLGVELGLAGTSGAQPGSA